MDYFENGSKIRKGIINIIELRGTWREMGRQYGALMSAELGDMYERGVMKKLAGEVGVDIEQMKTRSQKFFANYPFKFKEIIRGMAETSGLTMEQLLLVNAMELIAGEACFSHCTGIAVWGDYVSGPLVYGRNYDYMPWFSEFSDNIVVAVYHPADGSLSVATMGFAGEIYAVNGMNEKGLFLELNNGMPSGGALWYDSRVPAVAALFQFLLDCETLDDLESHFQTTKANFAYIIGVTDGQTARCYEWPVFEVKRRESHSRPGLIVLSNHFTEFSWGLPRPDDNAWWLTRTRRQNLLTLAKHLKGTIDNKTMMKMLDTKIEDLGATTDMTIYQMVVVPSRYELWFKISGSQSWTEIDMREYLKPRD